MMDATAGGSGFSFVDLMADRAGTLLAAAATKNETSARDFQMRVRRDTDSSQFLPDIEGLPEGLSREVFQLQFGGLGGLGTQEIVQEIQRRLATCKGLQTSK